MKTENIDKIVEKHFNIPNEIAFYIAATINDLYNGPRGIRDDDPYPYSFVTACNKIRDWFNDDKDIKPLWVDIDSEEIFTREPEGYTDKETGEYIEPYWANIYHYDYGDIKRVLFGRELSSYI